MICVKNISYLFHSENKNLLKKTNRLDYIQKKKYEIFGKTERLESDSNGNPENIKFKKDFLFTNLNFTKNEENLKNTNSEIKVYMKEGECFGDWAILNKNLKPSLAVASEETDIFY